MFQQPRCSSHCELRSLCIIFICRRHSRNTRHRAFLEETVQELTCSMSLFTIDSLTIIRQSRHCHLFQYASHTSQLYKSDSDSIETRFYLICVSLFYNIYLYRYYTEIRLYWYPKHLVSIIIIIT